MPRSLIALTALAVAFGSCSTEPAGGARDSGSLTAADASFDDAQAAEPPDADLLAPDAEESAPDADALPDATAATDASLPDAGPACFTLTAKATVVGSAAAAGEFALFFDAQSASATSWGQTGNEALVLEVLKGASLLGHVVLHQGAASFEYALHTGALAPGDAIALRVSPHSASAATPRALVCDVRLVPSSALGAMADGLLHAPVVLWPVAKRFDDLPVLLGFSKKRRHYEMVYTSENGGTVVQCGGGALGMEGEYARWGRGCDIEGIDNVGGGWDHCDLGDAGVPAPRVEGGHRVLYFGDNHNRLFVSRGGYGQACGTGAAEMADGPIAGFNSGNPGNQPAKDAPYVILVRLVPVDLDAIGYLANWGRREALLDAYAPWVYRLTGLELAREGKIDSTHCLPMERYLYADVLLSDVDGSGDLCNPLGASGGFKLRVNTSLGTQPSSAQITSAYAGGTNRWKRLVIPLDRVYTATQLTGFVFDAYDKDGIYLQAFGDAFMPRAQGDNGASLEYVHKGVEALNVYVDDDSTACDGGLSWDGPADAGYRCVGGSFGFKP